MNYPMEHVRESLTENTSPATAKVQSLSRYLKSHKAEAKTWIGKSAGILMINDLISKSSGSSAPVMLMGETGVGKEIIARTIHEQSDRSDAEFVAVNCATLPADLTEAELFGAEKGAYTGAVEKRLGKFERADGGTLFLDEVTELSAQSQAALLRVLQEGELERVGGRSTISVDVRVVTATNENMVTAVQEGRFRADLFHRLNVLPIVIPPLRNRVDDIPLLIEHFLDKYQREYRKLTAGISGNNLKVLQEYSWPGNVRELENVIHRGIVLTGEGEQIQLQSLFPTCLSSNQNLQAVSSAGLDKEVMATPPLGMEYHAEALLENDFEFEKFEEILITKALEKCQGNITKSASLLGLSRPALAYRIKKRDE